MVEATNSSTTPVPSASQQMKILWHRNFWYQDQRHRGLWIARLFLAAVMLMLYTTGFFLSYDSANDESGVSIVEDEEGRDVRVFEGEENWPLAQLPAQLRVAATTENDTLTDALYTEEVVSAMQDLLSASSTNSTIVSNTTIEAFAWSEDSDSIVDAILENCTSDFSTVSSDDQVCISLETHTNGSTLVFFYGGSERALPFAQPLAAAQWLATKSVQAVSGTSSSVTVDQIQPLPQLVLDEDIQANRAFLLTPGIMTVLSLAIWSMLVLGPMHTEQMSRVRQSLNLQGGVSLRVYLMQWMVYHGLHAVLTAGALTCVSTFYKLYPMSSAFLIFLSHWLALMGLVVLLVLIAQVVPQEELAQGIPWLLALGSGGLGVMSLLLGEPDSLLLTVLSVISPMVSIVQYTAIYVTYDITGFDIGIRPGDNVISSGLCQTYIAQLCCIGLWLFLSLGVFVHIQEDKRNTAVVERVQEDGQEKQDSPQDDRFEPLAPTAEVLLSIRNVHHTYTTTCCSSRKKHESDDDDDTPSQSITDKSKSIHVLKGLDMDICRGEVFGFLGHNGAGKSTSVQLFSTETTLQEGQVTYNFRNGKTARLHRSVKDGDDDLHLIRRNIGVCPQHNDFLQETLTCRELLTLFCKLKGGMPSHEGQRSLGDAVVAEVDRIIGEIRFTTKGDADKPISTYSGGMKRKVSIAVALIGNPEVVFLDEPTAGMDPYNRRQIWDMIIAAKPGRSIILTTHFLDEADVLSDRIGILKNGTLVTSGSSLFLKHQFGAGYTLRYESTHAVDVSAIVPDAIQVEEEQPPGHYEWKLAHGSESLFPKVLRCLNKKSAKHLKLDLTTLEQVFLETGKEDNEEEDDDIVGGEEEVPNDEVEEDDTQLDNLRKIWKRQGSVGPPRRWRKFASVVDFMMKNAWKMKGTVALNIIQPLIYLIVGLILAGTIESPDKGDEIVLDPIPLSPGMVGDGAASYFFGLPEGSMIGTGPILAMPEAPETLSEYFEDGTSAIMGGHVAQNNTLQYDSSSAFALQVGLLLLETSRAGSNGLSVVLQQLPYISEAPFRVDLLVVPLFLGFGFTGIAFVVLDVLLLKGDGIISLFRVAGISEWTSYMGVTTYKILTTFAPFFVVTIILGTSLGAVIMGDNGRWLGCILLMLCYAYATTPIGLILAKRFIRGNYKAVASWFPAAYMTFVSLPYVAWVSALQALPDSRDTILIIGDFMCLIPQVAFQRGLGALIELSTKFRDPDLTWGEVWKFENRVWFTMAVMFVIGSLEWFYLYRLTTKRPSTTKLKNGEDTTTLAPVDISKNSELSEEHLRSQADNEGINARELVKCFRLPVAKKKVDSGDKPVFKRAVKGVSFGVRKNEIYALLGPNGAGKSVTMGILASQHTPEHGQVALVGTSVSSEDATSGQLYDDCDVAYCPQFDALFPKMTVDQHLKFYSGVRNLDWENPTTQAHVTAIVNLLGLRKHQKKEASELSGGYKRRLSLALAMLGFPKAMIVDECTTGMDPGARHLVWAVLKPRNLQPDFDLPAILLSSHYMDECETLGTRIGIMIDGELTTTGTLEHLQSKYCTSYFVEVSFDPSKAEEDDHLLAQEADLIDDFTNHGMPCSVYESLPYRCKLQVPFVTSHGINTSDEMQLADIFERLEHQKSKLAIKFYSVAQMSLEQIFIDLSRKQFEQEEGNGELSHQLTSRRSMQLEA